MKRLPLTIFCFFLMLGPAQAKIDLVTLPSRDSVQVTIYNSADLTLVREQRALTLKEGFNDLQFSWVNTLIDPTSLEMTPRAGADKIDIYDLTFPARVTNLGVWHIKSGMTGKVPVEIDYLTSGLSWRAFYIGTLTENEETMRLKGYVRVTNNSGEDYENAKVRLIVGKVHMVDVIAELARRQYPYGSPYGVYADDERWDGRKRDVLKVKRAMKAISYNYAAGAGEMVYEEKEIVKEGLSEYFLYTIEGTETIPNGWSKRLPSFDVEEVPIINLYKYEEEKYGNAVVRFLSFKNDEEHELGETPIPGGIIKVFRTVDPESHLSYEGQSSFKYIPVDEDVELNLGYITTVSVKPTLMDFKTKNYMFDRWQNIIGWDEIQEYKVEVNNTRDIPVKIEIKRNFPSTYWKIQNQGDYGTYEKVDADTVKYTLPLAAKTKKTFTYRLTIHHGQRAER